MKSQDRRDAETVTIFAGLLLFLLVTTLGAVALLIIHQFVTFKADLVNVLAYVILGAAAVVSIRYIRRNPGR